MEEARKKQEDLLADWHQRTRVSQSTHYETAKSYSRRNLYFGIPTVALSAIVGTAVFSSLGDDAVNAYVQIVVGLLSISAAVLASLQTFLGFSEKAEEHRLAGAKFGAVRREIEEILVIAGSDSQEIQERISSVRKSLDELAADSPSTPYWAYKKAKGIITQQDKA